MPQGKGTLYGTYGYMALHHLLLNNDFEIADMLEQPVLNLLLGEIIQKQVAGQSMLEKLVMGDSFNTMATRRGDSAWDANPGTPIIVDATITPRKMVSRFQIDGTTVDNIKAGIEPKYTLEQMKRRYLDMHRKVRYRLLAGDGSGRICYLNATTASATLNLADDDGSTAIGATHPAWRHLMTGKHVDVILASTGLAIEGGVDLAIESMSKSGSTVTLESAVTVTGSKAYYIRFHTPMSDSTDPDYVADNALLPEPQGLEAIITATASYLGYSSDSYPDWFSPYKDLDGVTPALAHFDEVVAQMQGLEGVSIVGDSAIITQLRTEAAAKGQILASENKSIYEGVKGIQYQSLNLNQQPVPLLTAPEFNNTRRVYLVHGPSLAEAGATLKPTWRRGALVPSEAYDYMFDDMVMESNLYTGKRNRHGLLYDCGAAYGWNQVTQ